jgi:hypothetical protein
MSDGTMHVSVPELRRMAPDALRMSGLLRSQADECAEALVWTEAAFGGAISHLADSKNSLGLLKKGGLKCLRSPNGISVDARGGSLLEVGIRVFDFAWATARAENGHSRVLLKNVNGFRFLPYLVLHYAKQGAMVVARKRDAGFPLATNVRSLLTVTGSCTGSRSSALTVARDFDDEDHRPPAFFLEMATNEAQLQGDPFRGLERMDDIDISASARFEDAVRNGLSLSEQDFATISELNARVRVEAFDGSHTQAG